MDPGSKRLDRSGEKNLNPFDTHAIEAAMQIREGGQVDVDEIVAVTMVPDSAFRALHKKSASDVGIEADKVGEQGSKTSVEAINPPPQKEAGELIEDEDTDETVEKIVSWLDERKLLA